MAKNIGGLSKILRGPWLHPSPPSALPCMFGYHGTGIRCGDVMQVWLHSQTLLSIPIGRSVFFFFFEWWFFSLIIKRIQNVGQQLGPGPT